MAACSSQAMQKATPAVYEGDTVLFYCSDAGGFLYADPPCSRFSHVSVQQVRCECIKNPILPNMQFAAFQLQLVKATELQPNFKSSTRRALVFGQKVKLFHVASQKYLYISRVNDTDMVPVAVLKDEDDFKFSDDSSEFRILPGKLGKYRGDQITQEDRIKLQCTTHKGNRVYCTLSMLTAKFELKLGNADSTFTLHAYASAEESLSRDMLKAGEPCMLFSVEHEAFAFVNGSFASDTLPAQLQKEGKREFLVVAQSQHSEQGSQKLPVTSGNTFWQIEKLSDPLSGDRLHCHEECRVKHLLTRKYLALTCSDVDGKQQRKVTLKSLSADDDDHRDVSFTLTPIIEKRNGGLKKGSYVELRHTESGMALGVRLQSLSKSGQEAASSLVYMVVAMEAGVSAETVFKLEEVHESLVREFYHVTSIVSVFSNHMQQFIGGQRHVLDELSDTLEHLKEWLDRPELNKKWISMLQASKIIDQLMGYLALVQDSTKDYHLQKLCKQVCQVMVKYLRNSTSKALVHLSKDKFVSILLDKVGQDVKAESILQAIIHNDIDLGRGIMEKLLMAERSRHKFFEKLNVTVLKFFSTLCSSDGKPVKVLQDLILQFLLESAAGQLFRTEVEENEILLVIPDRSERLKLFEIANAKDMAPGCWIDTLSVKSQISCHSGLDLDYLMLNFLVPHQEDIAFFLAQIKLFSHICKGGNEKARSTIVDQEKYITFQEALLCLNNETVHPRVHSHYLEFVTSTFVEGAVEKSGTDIDNTLNCFAWPGLTPTHQEVLEKLIEFTVHNEEIQELKDIIRLRLENIQELDPRAVGRNELMLNMLRLMRLLVAYGFYCKCDSVEPVIMLLIDLIGASHCYEGSDENQVIFAIKSEAIRILHLLFKRYNYLALRRFIHSFKELLNGESKQLVADSENHEEDRDELVKLISFKFQLSKNPLVTNVCRRIIEGHFNEPCYQAMNVLHSKTSLVQLVIQQLHCCNEELQTASTQFLVDMHKRESMLFSSASGSYLCTEASFAFFDDLVKLGSLVDEDKLLVKMHTGKLGDLRQTLLDKLEKISAGCLLEGDPSEPHTCHQRITYSTRVFNQLLCFVLKHHSIENDCDKDIVEKACDVLINCTHKNPTIQAGVYEQLLDLLNAKIAVHLICRLFTEVLTDNPSLCRKLSEEGMRQIFKLATSSDNSDHFELCYTLQVAIKVSKSSPLMIQSNQDFVSKMFRIYPIDSRLFKNPFQQSETDQILIANAVDLLSVCCEKEGKYARKYAQGLYSVEDLVKIISNEEVPLTRRKPFACLLTKAFIKDKLKSSCDLLANESEFWKHVDYCAELLNSFTDREQPKTVLSEEQWMRVCFSLKLLTTSYMSIREWEHRTNDLDIRIAESASLGEALLYLFEGILPLVTAFCEEFEELCCSGPARKVYRNVLDREDIKQPLSKLHSSLANVARHMGEFAVSNAQVDLMINCFRALQHFPAAAYKVVLESFKDQNAVCHSIKKKYHNQFASEEDLNTVFRRFVRNFQLAYEGRFTGDAKNFGTRPILPQGPSFCALVSQFSVIADETKRQSVTVPFVSKKSSTNALQALLDLFSGKPELRLSLQASRELDDMLLTFLQLLTALVANQIASIDRNLQLKDPKEFQRAINTVVKPVQEYLLDKEVHEKIMLHLDHPKDEITVQVFKLLSMLLYFGNKCAQQKIGSFAKRYHTKMFIRMHEMLNTASSVLLKERANMVKFKQLKGLHERMPFAEFGRGSGEHLADAEEAVIRGRRIVARDLTSTQDVLIELGPLTLEEGLIADIRDDAAVPDAVDSDDEDDLDYSISECSYDEHAGSECDYSFSDDSGSEMKEEDEESDEDDDYEDADCNGVIEKYSGDLKLDITRLPEVQNANVVLEVLSWLCDGQNEDMQKVLKQQDIHLNSFNIVGQVAILLLGISSNLSIHTLQIAKGALQALIEMCTGNYLNQEAAFNGQAIDSIMKIISYGELKMSEDGNIPKKTVRLMWTKSSAVELLEVLLEETSEHSAELVHQIAQDIDLQQVVLFMHQMWQFQQNCEEKKKEHLRDETRKGIYRAFHVLCKVADNLRLTWEELMRQSGVISQGEDYHHDMWKHVCEWSHSMEIDYKPNSGKSILTKVYFPFDPERHLNEYEREVMKNKLKRDSPAEKLKSLLHWITSIRKNVEYNKRVRSMWYLNLALSYSDLRRWLLIFFTILMNLFTVFLLRAPDESENEGNIPDTNSSNQTGEISFVLLPVVPAWYGNYVLYFGGIFHLFLSLWMVLEYFINVGPYIRFRIFAITAYKIRRFFVKNKTVRTALLRYCICLRCFKIKLNKDVKPPREIGPFERDVISFKLLYRVIFLLCSIAALGTSGYFYCGCLLYIFMRNTLLLVVLSAVRHSAAQLFSVFILIFVIIYIYAVISFVFLHDFFDNTKGLFCRSLGECVVAVIRQGLLDTLGEGIPLTIPNVQPSFSIFWWRMVVDVSFAITITILALNIVVAVLVDRFSAIRNNKDAILRDQTDHCFICSIDSDVFERRGKGFWSHVHKDHYLWNYLYFVLYLDTLFENDRNAVEKYVYEKVDPAKPSIQFFPLHKAKVLPNAGAMKE